MGMPPGFIMKKYWEGGAITRLFVGVPTAAALHL
jgi:hypothetical protein